MSVVITRIPGTRYHQFGKEVLSTQLRFATLESLFEVDQQVQRQLDPGKRRDIRDFILDSLANDQPFYFSPFIFSSRGCIEETKAGFQIVPGSKLYILDGQHRSMALSSAYSHLRSQKEALEEIGDYQAAEILERHLHILREYPVSMQVYLDLNQTEERQAFTDCNTERRDAHKGLMLQYDQRDVYTELTRRVAEKLVDTIEIEFKASRLTDQNPALTSLITMRKCIVALFEGTLIDKKGHPSYYKSTSAELEEIAVCFFNSWQDIFPKRMKERADFVCSKTGIQLALAQSAHHIARAEGISSIETFERLKLLSQRCTWAHSDPAFAHMYDEVKGRVTNHSTTTSVKRTVQQFLQIIEQERMTVRC